MSHTTTRLERKRTARSTEKEAIDATPPTPPTPTKEAPNHSVFDQLPNSAWLRESQLVRSPKRPESTAPLPFSAPTLHRKVRAGSFPAPVKLSARVTAWNCGDVRRWLAAQTAT